jgi:hypothetical protein
MKLLKKNRIGLLIKLLKDNKNMWSVNNFNVIFCACISENTNNFRIFYYMNEHSGIDRNKLINYDNDDVAYWDIRFAKYNIENINDDDDFPIEFLDHMQYYMSYIYKIPMLLNLCVVFGWNFDTSRYMLNDDFINMCDSMLEIQLINYYLYADQTLIDHVMTDEIHVKCPNLVKISRIEKRNMKVLSNILKFDYKTFFS